MKLKNFIIMIVVFLVVDTIVISYSFYLLSESVGENVFVYAFVCCWILILVFVNGSIFVYSEDIIKYLKGKIIVKI